MRDVLKVLWRPTVSAAIMALVVVQAFPVNDVSNDTLHNALMLAGAVGLGMGTYTLAAALLWLLSGRPNGAEQWLLSRVQPYFLRSVRRQP